MDKKNRFKMILVFIIVTVITITNAFIFTGCNKKISYFEGTYECTSWKEYDYTEYWGKTTKTNEKDYLGSDKIKLVIGSDGKILKYLNDEPAVELNYQISGDSISFLNNDGTGPFGYALVKSDKKASTVSLYYESKTREGSGVSHTGHVYLIRFTKVSG